ncbi:peptidoglycan DD-metalloendopeptidase family protein [Crenobacter sp. SG2303]|uniref:Peptidoglycan DD-metalloendopeptidase family protein n=1 Tax=Crenobacter oryzisoli TaxID=3056844 RepID=A0ABT7XU46_9NEIS|nr:peptidoglycan DD-metalloendopeptidase family protein [Crenobacter sp. SG2303]MDN0077255.1 peptidoglycan DD-metalloendopeptidase family protein [Crenobacter sp. SG2303]
MSTAPHQQDLSAVRKQIDSVQKDIAQKEAVHKEAQSAIQQSEQALKATNQAIATLEKKQSSSQRQLEDLRAKLAATRAKVADTRSRVNKMLVSQYSRGQHDAMSLMLNADDPNQSARDLTYYKHIARAQTQLVASLKDQQAELEALEQRLQAELGRLEALSDNKSQEKDQLENTKAQQQVQAQQIATQIQGQQQKLTELKASEKRLTNLIAEIQRQIEARRREAERKAAEARKARLLAAQQAAKKENERRRKLAEQAKKQGKPVPKEARQPVKVQQPDQRIDEAADTNASGRAFRSLQGKMKLPVAGTLTGRFGTPRDEGTTWKGVFIKSPAGQPVRAVADGQVVYADVLRGFGNAVIVDHGGGYMTVYTGLSGLSRSVGASLKAGDTIGNTGALDSGESGLYFEIRYMGRPVNPLAWAR